MSQPTPQVAQVRALAEKAAASNTLVVEDVQLTSVGRRHVLLVVVDLPEDQLGSVGMDAIGKTTRELSDALDANGILDHMRYVLEVTSPGAERTLTERRHWLRARQRTVHVRMTDGTTHTGVLERVDDDGVLVGETTLNWPEIARGHMLVTFGGS